ncbi:MAG TPA: ATP-binding protein [Candidatus Cloacimonadota bacterium]|nr:ATP-binding protein [Candidatus Cloacimonadota bacterium]
MSSKKLEARFEASKELREKIQIAELLTKEIKEPKEKLFFYHEFIYKNCHFSDYEEIRVKTIDWLANYYFFKSDFDMAIELAYEILYLLEDKKGSDIWFDNMNLLAVTYNALNQKDKAKEVYEQILPYKPRQIKIWDNYSCLLTDLKEYDKAIEYITTAMELNKGNISEYLDILTSLENYYIKTNQPQKAADIFVEQKENIEKHAIYRTQCFHYLNYAEALLALNRLPESIEIINRAIAFAEQYKNDELLFFSYSIAIEVYEKSKNLEKTNEYLKKLLSLNQRLYASQSASKTKALEARAMKEKQQAHTYEMIDKGKNMVSVGIMASGITHEINQPLNAIMIEAQTLIFKDNNEKVLPESYRERINYIIEGAERINAIIKHIRSNWINNDCIDKKEFDVNQTINNAISLINQQLKAHGIIFRVKLDPKSVTLYGTPISMEQALINLIINAMHALDTLNQREKFIRLTTMIKENSLLIHLEDNGPGISDDIANKIFDPFFTQKPKEQGTGLGLTLVQNFVKDLNGKIVLVKEKRKGTHFLITIPF